MNQRAIPCLLDPTIRRNTAMGRGIARFDILALRAEHDLQKQGKAVYGAKTTKKDR